MEREPCMKVLVEIEVHEGCAKCPLFYSGQTFDWCKFPCEHDMFGRLDMDNYKKRPKWCPLGNCKKVEEELTKYGGDDNGN